jgi:hypothetical protein
LSQSDNTFLNQAEEVRKSTLTTGNNLNQCSEGSLVATEPRGLMPQGDDCE